MNGHIYFNAVDNLMHIFRLCFRFGNALALSN